MTETAIRTKPVTPRHAASLILIRPGRKPGHDGVEVLMGRRASKHRFMPHMYAFPGGRVDNADNLADRTTDYRPHVFEALTRSTPRRLAHALGTAAIRETFEETGLLIGEKSAASDGAVIIRPDLAALDYFVRAITPPRSPIRFHARFFIASASQAKGEIGGSGELLDLEYRPIEDCLKLPLVDITQWVLGNLAARLADPKADPILWHYKGNGPVFRPDLPQAQRKKAK